MTRFIILAILWYVSGVVSFIEWRIQKHDLTISAAFVSLILGLFGPIIFLVGMVEERKDIVLIKKRKED